MDAFLPLVGYAVISALLEVIKAGIWSFVGLSVYFSIFKEDRKGGNVDPEDLQNASRP